ncbi:MAG: hypothetical protein K6A77_00880 [Clostridiales bacterium]|nr:hypothetical protein [Clostridiales bacterium]
MKLKMILALVLAIVLLAGCSSAPKKEESKPAASESSKEESSKKEETSSKTEVSEEEEDEEEPVEETPEEEAPEEEEEEEAEPQPEASDDGAEPVNDVYKLVGKDAPEDTLLILINEPDEAFLYATRVSDEFELTTLDRVMIIPRYEHSTIRLWTLKTEFSEDGETAMQVHDEMLYEIQDSTLETVMMTSVPRIEDSARYALEVLTPHGDSEYYFNFYGDDLPEIEYIQPAKG